MMSVKRRDNGCRNRKEGEGCGVFIRVVVLLISVLEIRCIERAGISGYFMTYGANMAVSSQSAVYLEQYLHYLLLKSSLVC